MKKPKKYKIIAIIIMIAWGAMIFTDYTKCKRVEKPIFAVPVFSTDCDEYQGLGYTIIIRYDGAIGESGETLKGYFFWGF